MGECSAYSSLQADSKVKFAAWRPPGAGRLAQMNHSELSHMAGAVDDSTINIVLVIIILIIYPFRSQKVIGKGHHGQSIPPQNIRHIISYMITPVDY